MQLRAPECALHWAGRRGSDLADACMEPDEGAGPAAGDAPRPPLPDGEEGELVEAAGAGREGAAACGAAQPGPAGPAFASAAVRARSGGEDWEVL